MKHPRLLHALGLLLPLGFASCSSSSSSSSGGALVEPTPAPNGSPFKTLDEWHLFWSTKADLLRRMGQLDEAAEAYRRALACEANAADRRFLQRRLDEVSPIPPAAPQHPAARRDR